MFSVIAGVVIVIGGLGTYLFLTFGTRRVVEIGNRREFRVLHPHIVSVGGTAGNFGSASKAVALADGNTLHTFDLETGHDTAVRLPLPAGAHGLVINADATSWAAIAADGNILLNEISVTTAKRPQSLAFSGDNLIALMYDGSLAAVAAKGVEPLDGERLEPIPAVVVVPDNAATPGTSTAGTASPASPRDRVSPYAHLRTGYDAMMVVDLPQKYVGTFSPTATPLQIHHYRWDVELTGSGDAVLLKDRRVGVWRDDTALLLSQGPLGQTAVTVARVRQPITAMMDAPQVEGAVSYNNAIALVALAGGGLRLIDSEGRISTPKPLPEEPRTIRELDSFSASSGQGIAYATDDALVTFEIQGSSVTTPAGWTIVVLSVLCGIAVLVVSTRVVWPEERPPVSATPDGETYDLAPPSSDLIDACASGECVIYAGTQLSEAAGVGAPWQVAQSLLRHAVTVGLMSEREAKPLEASIEGSSGTDDVDPVLDYLSDSISRAGGRELRLTLGAIATPAHRYLRRLAAAPIVTPNLDEVLDKVVEPQGVVLPADVERMLELSSRRERFLLKLRGTAAHPQSFEAAVARLVSFSDLLRNLFLSRTMLFVGASLEEISRYLNALRLSSEVSTRHYALVRVSGDEWQARAAFLDRRLGVRVLPYSDEAALDQFLSQLADQTEIAAVSSSASVPTASRLVSVELQNIGPFVHQEFTFDSRWTVLLGNNGVGKSNVLRALAVALAGRAAEPYAGRIVRSGASAGWILIRTTRGRYLTEINKRSDGTAEMRCPVNILEAERWLILGFPPLRVMTWQRGAATVESRPRPTSQDVLPLASGGVDPRVDELKSWILQQTVNALDEKTRTKSDKPTKYDRLLATFFEVVNRLTPKLEVRLGKVDVQAREVQVVMENDVPVPIESVSQGTISLIGWIGVVVQRLFDVYGNSDGDPLSMYALVLVDEIDAHMHPEWQKELAPLLADIFPRVQFVATTHSPLIVSELSNEQVLILSRENAVVDVLRPEEDLSALRADQMLTSLFGLRFTRNRRTQKEVAEYARLLGMSARSSQQERRFKQLRAELSQKLTVSEGPVDRGVEKVVRQTVAEVAEAAPRPSVGKDAIPEEAAARLKEQLKELFTDENPR